MSDDLPPELATLYAIEREPIASDADRNAVIATVAATLGLGAVTTTAASAATAASPVAGVGAGLAGITGKLVALVLTVGAIGAGTAVYVSRDRAPAVAVTTSAAPRPSNATAVEAPVTIGASTSSPGTTVVARPVVVAPPAAVHPPADPDALERPARSAKAPAIESQQVLIARAWSLHARGDASGVLGVVELDAKVQRDGNLAEEREVLRIVALTRLGRGDDARTSAASFARRYPSSLHRALIERAVTESAGGGQ